MYTAVDTKQMELANGNLVMTDLLVHEIGKICHYVHHVVLALKDSEFLVAMIFPNAALFTRPDYALSPEEGCFCPRNLNELGKCLSGCISTVNGKIQPGFAKVNAAIIINAELSERNGTLSADQVPVAGKIIERFESNLRNLFGEQMEEVEEAYNMNFW